MNQYPNEYAMQLNDPTIKISKSTRVGTIVLLALEIHIYIIYIIITYIYERERMEA